MFPARVLFVVVLLGMLPGKLIASLMYEANQYPELDGWTAVGCQDYPALLSRSVQEGIFTISASVDAATNTSYYHELTSSDSQTWKLGWRSRTSNNDGSSYLTVRVGWGMMLVASRADELIFSYTPPDNSPTGMWDCISTISQGVFHAYELLIDHDSFTIMVDDQPRLSLPTGQPPGTTAKIQFGFTKDWYHVPTQSEWDYVRVTPIPEPMTLVLFGLALACRLGRCSF